MNVDLEAAGAAVTAGLVAKEIDGVPPAGKNAPATCANCRTQTVGKYCHVCGQAAHVHRSLWHMLHETLHGVFHFDTKSWRTLPLLIARPGLLTRRYIDGQRVRYVSPLALFLFATFLMYFVFSMVNIAGHHNAKESAAKRGELVKDVAKSDAAVAKRTAALAAAKDASDRLDAREALAEAQLEQRMSSAALAAFDAASSAQPNAAQVATGVRDAIDAQQGEVGEGGAAIESALKRNTENPELLLYKLKNTAYKYSFLLIPISLPFMWLMFFWRPGVTLFDHSIFSMYSLAFMSLYFSVLALMSLNSFTARFVGAAAWVVPLHIFLQLKETYNLRFWSALWRTLAMLWFALIAAFAFLIMVAVISAE